MGACHSACSGRDFFLELAGPGGVRMHLSGRGGQDSMGDAPLPEIHMGEGLDQKIIMSCLINVNGRVRKRIRTTIVKVST